jgi:hypothetical protein
VNITEASLKDRLTEHLRRLRLQLEEAEALWVDAPEDLSDRMHDLSTEINWQWCVVEELIADAFGDPAAPRMRKRFVKLEA